MKIYLIIFFALTHASSAFGGVSAEDVWNTYSKKVQPKEAGSISKRGFKKTSSSELSSDQRKERMPLPNDEEFPGKLVGNIQSDKRAFFSDKWKFRNLTYELYFENPEQLARTSYSLAIFVKDIDRNIPFERFINGVSGYRFSASQVCDWLNHYFSGKDLSALAPSGDELVLLGYLLQDRIIKVENFKFVSSGQIRHLLAASVGKKRSFGETLRHERLHVVWVESEQFRREAFESWKRLPDAQKIEARKSLKQYSQGNEEELVKEWAVRNAEKADVSVF